MKTFNLLLGLLLGLIIGLLTALSSILFGLLWFTTVDTDKSTGRKPTGYSPSTRHKGNSAQRHEYETLAEAEEVLDALVGIIADGKEVRMADLKNALGELTSYQDLKYGWKDLSQAHITRDLYSRKFRIEWPEPIRL